jgi:predicted PurR-regulated permease PerM
MDSGPLAAVRQDNLRRVVVLLRIVVVALAIGFCYYANSLCITIVVACFLSILIDPIVSYFERGGIPRPLSAALLIVAGMLSLGSLAYFSYSRTSTFVESLPEYTDRIREFVNPITQKISKMEESAGKLSADTTPASKKVTDVKLKEPPAWPSYLVRGFGSITSIGLTLGVLPFLMFFMLTRKGKWSHAVAAWLGPGMGASEFSSRFALIVRRFLIGNLVVGGLLAVGTCALLFFLKINGALMLGIVSGALNLLPFLGVILAILVPVAAAVLQYSSVATILIIAVAITALHILAGYLLIPRFVGSRINVGPIAATVGILFWGWLWGIMGILLALPLTGAVKLIVDCQPSLAWLSELLGNGACPAPIVIREKREEALLHDISRVY